MNFKDKILGCMLLCFAAFSVTVLTSCEDEPDKYEVTGGSPTIHYIRLSDVTKKDSMLTGAYMGANICIVGENLTSIKKMYFNDQEAILNTSFMTYHTLLVDIPTTLTDNPTNKIYMVNSENDTTTYDFTVLVPNPVVSSISNEFAADGEEVTIKGDYLLNYESYPLEITFAGNIPVTEFTSYSKTSVTFKVPEDAQKGYVTVESMYGKSRSKFYFRDDRNILFDWDDDGDEALSSGHGWRNGNVRNDVDGVTPLDGNYLYFGGATLNFDTWNEDAFSFNYWPDTDNGYPELTSIINGSDISQLQLKFEVNIPVAWSACSMQLIFTGNDQVTYNTGTNSYIADDTYPRALWTPWYGTESGSYTTSGWETVTIPLSDFAYDRYGNKLDALKIENMTGLTFFLYTGPYKDSSVECSPVVCIDNIRIAPIE